MKNLKSISTKQEADVLTKHKKPNIKISKLGIVARDYRESKGNSDFSKSIIEILKYLDAKGCDSVLFSLYTILERNSLKAEVLEKNKFKHLKSLFIEEFKFEKNERDSTVFKVYHKQSNKWRVFEFAQKFARLEYTKKFERDIIAPFIKEVKESRIMGNCIVLLCGETNVVKYSKQTKQIEDKFNLLENIPTSTNIVLNPVHDKMTRFEMKLKRQYLSLNDRIVISVWNKGKTLSNGKTIDGNNPPWTIYKNGNEVLIKKEKIPLQKNTGIIDIGILNIKN